MYNAVFGKAMENVRKYRDIKLVTTERRKNISIRTKSSYYKVFDRKVICNRNEKILELSKMCEFWYDYVKQKYGEKVKLCYMDTNSFIVYIKNDGIYKDITEDVKTRFDTSNYELDRLLSKGKS